jgi:hypothetical protein
MAFPYAPTLTKPVTQALMSDTLGRLILPGATVLPQRRREGVGLQDD